MNKESKLALETFYKDNPEYKKKEDVIFNCMKRISELYQRYETGEIDKYTALDNFICIGIVPVNGDAGLEAHPQLYCCVVVGSSIEEARRQQQGCEDR